MDAHDLYGLPFERFVPERNALAKELRAAGRREQAESVAALRKPSISAWAVNQLVRTQSRDVAELFAAGDDAQRAQAELLAGRGDAAALRDALTRERQAVGRLVERARGLLSGEGHELSPTMLERVSETLHAAALEEDARASVGEGCLDRELRHVGLSAGALTAAPGARPRSRAKRAASSEPRPDLSALRKAEAQARRAADRATKELGAAEERREAAAAALAQSDTALSDARGRAEQAAAAHAEAARELDKALHKR